MKPHYSEADLLETYYTQPGSSMPVMMHLAECEECAARYAGLERKLRSMHSCEPDRPDTFWARQRLSIMRRVGVRHRASRVAPAARVAAAAALALVLGGVVTWNRSSERTVPTPAVETAAVATTATATPVPADTAASGNAADPWQSDELKDFQSIVAWESWGDPGTRNGGQSL